MSQFQLIIFLLLLVVSSSSFGNNQMKSKIRKDTIEGIYYSLHIIWEGLDVKDHNINELVNFRENHPNIKIIHHISPMYVLGTIKKYRFKEILKKVFKNGDVLGAYLSGWKEVIDESDVKFNANNSFWGNTLHDDCNLCGSEIPLTNYGESDLNKIISTSLEEIGDLGFGYPLASYIAGWQNNEILLKILAENKIQVDFSLIAPYKTYDTLAFQNIYKLLIDTWGNESQPLNPQVTIYGKKGIFQLPNNFAQPGIIPYSKAKKILMQTFKSIERKIQKGSIISLMILQNRLANDINHLNQFTVLLQKKSKESNIALKNICDSPIFLDTNIFDVQRTKSWNWPNHQHQKTSL